MERKTRLNVERIACIIGLLLGLTAVYISLYNSRQTQLHMEQLRIILLHSDSDGNHLMRTKRSSHPYNIRVYRERQRYITCRRHLDRYLATDEWRERLDSLVREALAQRILPLPIDKGAKQEKVETPPFTPLIRSTPSDPVSIGEESSSTTITSSETVQLQPLSGCIEACSSCQTRCHGSTTPNRANVESTTDSGADHHHVTLAPTEFDPSTFYIPSLTLEGSNNGASFIRWGKRTCPSPSTTIDNLDGFVSGGILHTGGGSNLICLPQNIQATQTTAKLNISEGPVIQAAFYRDISESGNERNERERNDGVLLCTQCITSTSQIVKFHGRNTCPSGWTLFYRGHLLGAVSGVNQSLALTSHECLDEDPDALTPSSRDSRALTLSLVTSGECNDDWCQNYKSGNLIPCVVCGI